MKIYCLVKESNNDVDYVEIINMSKDKEYIDNKYNEQINSRVCRFRKVLDNADDAGNDIFPFETGAFFRITKITQEGYKPLSFYREAFHELNLPEEQKLELYKSMAIQDLNSNGIYIRTYELEDFLD